MPFGGGLMQLIAYGAQDVYLTFGRDDAAVVIQKSYRRLLSIRKKRIIRVLEMCCSNNHLPPELWNMVLKHMSIWRLRHLSNKTFS